MPVLVTIGERDGRLRLTVDGVERWGDRLVLVEDRVLATGGELTAETPQARGRTTGLIRAARRRAPAAG